MTVADEASKPAPFKKGDAVSVKCDGFNYEAVLTADDAGGDTLEVSVMGKVARGRVRPR